MSAGDLERMLPSAAHFGYPVLAALILCESAGIPVPGETALLTAGGLAASGRLSLPLVILTAAVAAIAGDTIGYWLGRRGGRAFLLRDGIGARHRRRVVGRAEGFMARHGTATVFLGRWLPGLRFAAALMAGAAGMPWRRFAVANTAGGLLWAATVTTLAMLVGPTGALLLAATGLASGGLALAVGAWKRRGQVVSRPARVPARRTEARPYGRPVPAPAGARRRRLREVRRPLAAAMKPVRAAWASTKAGAAVAALGLARARVVTAQGVAAGPSLRVHPRTGALARLWSRYHLAVWIALAAAVTLGLRAQWFGMPLGNDEGGLTYIARSWHSHAPFSYGELFIDRPPLLLLLFRLAAVTGGTASVRTIGTLVALALVIVVTLLARELGGRRAVPWAALLAGALGSSLALGSVFLPAELPAAVVSATSVLALVAAHRRPRGSAGLFFAAGALAIAALLVKQSFGDAAAAGVVYLIAVAALERPGWPEMSRRLLPYVAGMACTIVLLELWERIAGVPDGAMSYALLGFRLHGLSALAGTAGGLPGRFAARLLVPLIASGLPLVLLWTRPGLRALKHRPVLRVTVAAWGIAGVAGILVGGSYWPHYLIEIVPCAAVICALALLNTSRRRALATIAVLALFAAGAVIFGPSVRSVSTDSHSAAAVGQVVQNSAHPTDTVYVRYSQANVMYYSGLRTRYPYAWSLMLRSVPHAQRRLRHLLRSPQRPTWIVAWEHDTAYGLDRDHRTARLISSRYRPVASVCGHSLLLEDGVHRSIRPPSGHCS